MISDFRLQITDRRLKRNENAGGVRLAPSAAFSHSQSEVYGLELLKSEICNLKSAN